MHGIVGKLLAMGTDDRAPTLEAAKDQFEAAWPQWLAWADLHEGA
jgi:hypothetical protein